ncbi:FtsX-like permease family protein [Candidatus Bathyarchaeota archaeon]|nr:FtsX-like permease family protein [Candidatus Bathyarchaeota archaeon]
MFSYAVKRITRGRGLFLSLFLSVALAATLFSGILQGADAIGVAILDETLETAYVDIISSAPDKNVTKTHYFEVDELFSQVDGVRQVDHFIRWGVMLNSTAVNATIEASVLALPSDSSLYDGMNIDGVMEDGVIYIDASSTNATEMLASDPLTIIFNTYMPFNPPGFEYRSFNYTVAGSVGLNERAFKIGTSRYNIFLRDLIQGREELSRRPKYNLILMTEDTLIGMLKPVFKEMRRPTQDQTTEALITLDREQLINPWDIQGSSDRLQLIFENINTEGAEYYYLPRSYLGELLNTISELSSQMKTSTILVALPVFFCAWYLGMTVSDVVFNLRRREIGLLFTRGMDHRQVLYILIFEGLMVSALASVVGVLAGAGILVLVIPGMGFLDVLRSVSPITLGATLAFSTVLSLLAVYKPAQQATQITIVDALKEHQSDEEDGLGDWQTALIAFVFGAYKIGMLLLGLTVDQFKPEAGNLIVNLLYSTWWGTDYLLGFIAPVLLFWGFIKLFLKFIPGSITMLGRLASVVSGDAARFSALSSGRNLKRVAASTFMVALIMSYSVSVIGNVASTTDFMEQAVRFTIGADASVWLFEGDDVQSLKDRIAAIDGVLAIANETHFTPVSSLGDTPIRAIDPLEWKEAAYIELDWVDPAAFEAMARDTQSGIMERGAAEALGIGVNNTALVKLQSKLYPIRIVGLYGKEPGELWTLQNPTIYVNQGFLDNVKEKFIEKRRMIVDLADYVDLAAFKEQVESLDSDIERVDVTALQLDKALSNIYLAGPRRVEELGAYFAGLVASLGVALIVSTLIRSRIKELTIMSIRGYSPSQMAMSLLFENVGMDLLAIALGGAVGFVSLRGQVELFNQVLATAIQRRVVFPGYAQTSLLIIVALLLVSTVAPIIVAVRGISASPDLKLEE